MPVETSRTTTLAQCIGPNTVDPKSAELFEAIHNQPFDKLRELHPTTKTEKSAESFEASHNQPFDKLRELHPTTKTTKPEESAALQNTRKLAEPVEAPQVG